MKIGLFSPVSMQNARPEFLSALGQGAELRGLHSLWLADPHLVLFDEYKSRYPYAPLPDGKMAEARDEPDVFATLSFLAAVTTRIRLGTGIVVVPQRNPVYLAKEVTTLDRLSEGRLDFGVGIGWFREEFDLVGAPWENRAARFQDYLEVMLTLWRDPVSKYDGDFYSLPESRQETKPVQRPHPPIHIGGESDQALRRVAIYGQGWYGNDLGPDAVHERLAILDGMLAEHGRQRGDIEVSVGPFLRQVTIEMLESYARAGVTQLILLVPIGSQKEIIPTLDRLTKTIAEPAAKL